MFSLYYTLVRFARSIWQGLHEREFRVLLILVIIILTSGMFFYHHFEGWRFLDALYFSVTTLTTVGYGDFSPQTDVGKIFTIIYIFLGIGIILGFINAIAHHAEQKDARLTEHISHKIITHVKKVIPQTLKENKKKNV